MAASLLLALALQSAAAPQLNPNLEPLAFVVGSCWRGTFPDGRQTDTHCFTLAYGGAFIRDRHVVENGPRPYSGETFYRWDAAARQIRFDYYAMNGNYSAGQAIPEANGLRFPDELVTANGQQMTIRSSWTRDGADAYHVIAEARQGEGWRELWRMRMVRSGPAREP
ncbi:hypothetical protein [Sphingosinicella sp.]|uniref:hypothetical protein n=1 Tax=Sphingosinicella sp. TaxID=1917971 RepID=UPI00403847FB